MNEKPIYYFYYSRRDETNYCLEEGTKKIITMTKFEKAQCDYKFFEMNKKYKPVPESLYQYEIDFNRCAKEIYDYTKGKFDYKKWLKDGIAVTTYFKLKSSKCLNKYNIEPTERDELKCSELCNNGGLLFLDDKYKRITTECYGYDLENCYATMLSSFKTSCFLIATKAGKWVNMKTDIMKPTTFKYGYYKSIISTEHPIIMKYFNFSTDNMYTHIDMRRLNYLIQFIMKTNKKATVQTIFKQFAIDENCYLYDEKDLIECSKIFYMWFKEVNQMKKDLKGNMLVKNLSTTLWGRLTQYNRIFVNADEIDNYEYGMCYDFTKADYEYLCIEIQRPSKENKVYELVKTDDAYKMGGIARLKSFLIAQIRFFMTKLILDNNLDNNVIRICTDGICLNKEVDFSTMHLSYYPKPEDKTTGFIKFYHANDYYHVCQNCNKEYKYDKLECHECLF